jgi:hypothetical protein
MAAFVSDQKLFRTKWTAEKSELEGKVFQLIAAQTQYQGTIRKKDKEFEKLQLYLQKQIKEISSKSSGSISGKATVGTVSKISNVSSIVISKPLPSNSQQQTKPGQQWAKDLEMMAYKNQISELEVCWKNSNTFCFSVYCFSIYFILILFSFY